MQFIKIIFALALLCSNGNALAANSPFEKAHEDSAKVRLIGSKYQEGEVKKLILALDFDIAKGWKIYGEDSEGFGLPPQLNFNNSQNYKSHKIIYPEAHKAEEQIGNETIRYSYYKGEVVLPIEIELTDLNKDTIIDLQLDYGVCKDVCIPASAKFSLKIDDEIDNDILAKIQPFYAKKISDASVNSSTNSFDITHFKMLFYAIIFGIIGGAILNIMPCVLPVLSIKLMSIINHSSAETSRIRFAFISTISGILFSFLLLSFLTVFVKSIGDSLGWGLQFQNPYFLIFLICILTFFAANLFGIFEISLQQFLINFLNKKISTTEKHNIFIPNFLSGILAVLLATPCSAPFLGSAISFALVSDFITILIVFMAIGVGFALPYFILIFSPKLISYLPKPGNWMVNVKKLMGVFLLATIIWLLDVLSNDIGDLASVIMAVLVVLVFVALKIKSHFFRAMTIALLVISIFALPSDFKPSASHDDEKMQSRQYDEIWQNFSEENLAKYLAQDKVVLIDITASWCLTCKFNKVRVLHDSEIMKLLKSGKVIGLRGDLTKPDKKITEFMKSKNRFAIPFNAVYGPNAKDGLLTSELLSKKELLELINKAGL